MLGHSLWEQGGKTPKRSTRARVTNAVHGHDWDKSGGKTRVKWKIDIMESVGKQGNGAEWLSCPWLFDV